MLELWKWYQNCLAVHPVKKQVISSGFIWGFGDIAAKSIAHHTAKKYHQIKVFISIITCHSRKSFFFFHVFILPCFGNGHVSSFCPFGHF
jgi:hypothetical protein